MTKTLLACTDKGSESDVGGDVTELTILFDNHQLLANAD